MIVENGFFWNRENKENEETTKGGDNILMLVGQTIFWHPPSISVAD
jgi:hypothetical protein